MSSNKNLFYNLYSTSNVPANSGYKCLSAVDEGATSFDITGSAANGAVGTITDSNGNALASIPMNAIHAGGITQYTTETRILYPYSCCLLQGQEYGLACAAYYFLIPKQIKDAKNYEKSVSCDFDVIYNNFTPYRLHISTSIDGENSFVDLINDELENNNVEVVASILELEDPRDNKMYEYLVFTSQKEGYFYYINNLQLEPGFQSEQHPDSPFSKALSSLKTVIYELIEQNHPMADCDCDADCSCGCGDPQIFYDPDTYEVDCELYSWLINNYQDCVDNLDKFEQAIQCYKLYEETGDDTWLEKGNELIKDTAYDAQFLEKYYNNLSIIADIVEQLKAFIDATNDYYQERYWLIEDRKRRIPLMKYPNGAFRGIVIMPEWPTNDGDEENAYKSLWINHVKSEVKLYRPTKEHQFLPKIYGVLSSATVVAELDSYKEHNPNFNGILTNGSLQHDIPEGWDDHLDTNYLDPYRPEHSIYEDTMYMGQNCYPCKKNIIGLFRYMQYVNDNKLWNKVGEAYMIIGAEDDVQSKDKNLPTSLVIYNPNPEPIRIKYMIFS